MVKAENLDSSKTYTIQVSSDDANIGFSTDCSSQQSQAPVTAGSSHVADFTLYGCAATEGTVTAALVLDGNTIDTDTQDVAVVPDPTISIVDLVDSMNEEDSDAFTVSVSNLVSSSSYKIQVNTNRDDLGFDTGCGTGQSEVTVPAGTSHIANFTLYGCTAPGGTVTATLLLGNTIVDTATRPVAVSLGETVTITGLGANLNVGATDPFTVIASNLDTLSSYTLQVTTDGGGGIGFNPDCTDHEEEVTVPADSASYTITADSLSLYGCGTDGGTVTATLLSGNTTIAEMSRVVTVQVAGSPTISIDDLLPGLNEGASDAFTVSVGNLDSSTSYTIEVTADNSDIGFNSDCTTLQQTSTVTAGEMSHSASFTLYGCDSTGGIVTAKLLSDGNTVVSDTQKVKVNEPTITIQGLALSLNEAASHSFTVGVDNLDSSSSYTIRLTTDDDDLGFNSDCSNRLHDVPVTANSTSFTTSSLTLYGCDAPGGTVTAILLRGTAEVARDTQDVTVNEPTIQIVGLADDVNQGASRAFVVSVGHLAASSGYTIQLSSSNGNIGFDAGCSLQQSDQTVPSATTSHTASFTLYGCAAATETITAKLLRGGTEVKTATQDVTVNASTIAIEELDAPLNEEDSRQFTVRVEHLGSSQPYTIQITTNNANIGFNNDCSDQQEEVTVQNSTSHTSALLLYGCVAPGGTVTARLLLDSTEVDTDSQPVTVVLNPTIEITGLVGTIDQGENDEFTVAAQHLVSSQNYAIRVTAENGIGFNSDCSNQSEPVTVPAGGSHSASLRLYACTAIGGTVTVNLLLDSNSIATDTHDVTVIPSPTISISDLATSIDVGASDEFTVSAQHLDSSQNYAIRVTAEDGIGFNSDCSNQSEPVTVPANSQAYTSNAGDLVLYGCGTAGGTVTAKLLIGNTDVDTATQPVTVQMAGSPTITIEGLVSELNKDASDSFTVSVANLDSSTSYTIELTTDDAAIGFNSDCTDREEPLTVTANSLSHTTGPITLYGCDAERGKVTATLKSGGGSLVSAEQTVTVSPVIVSPDPTVQISGLLGTVYVGANDAFTVSASHLDSLESYTIRVTTNNANIGFNDDCTDQQEDPTVPANIPSHTTSTITLYGCATTGGTVTATLSSGGNTIDTATQTVTVSIRPSIQFSGLVRTITEGASDDFALVANDLDSLTTYTIRVTTDSSNIGFSSDCTDQQDDPTVPASITSHTTSDITLYACTADGGTVTATLLVGGSSLVTAEQDVTVPLPSSRQIGFGGWMGPWRVGWGHSDTHVSVQQLDSSKSYKVELTLDDDEDGDRIGLSFDSGCSQQEKEVTVPADSTSHDIWFEISGCDRTTGSLTVKILVADDNTVVATETHLLQVFEEADIRLYGLDDSTQHINVGASEKFGIILHGLDSTRTYTVQIKTDKTGASLDSACTVSEKVIVLTGKTEYTTSAGDFTVDGTTYDTLYGCSVKRGSLNVRLYRGDSVQLNSHRWDFHTINVRNP